MVEFFIALTQKRAVDVLLYICAGRTFLQESSYLRNYIFAKSSTFEANEYVH